MLLLTKYTVLYKENEICCIILLSLPSRERGLKFVQPWQLLRCNWSLPSRERGLKYLKEKNRAERTVAPFAGAWIEICLRQEFVSGNWSLPSRERGLKLSVVAMIGHEIFVAPFAGAWIEMLFCLEYR